MDPARLRILNYPAPVLRDRADAVSATDPEVRAVAERMIELMIEAEGVGLAAPQVGLSWRLFVADVPADAERSADADPPEATRGPLVFINPVLVSTEGPPEPADEGCLSLPDIRGDVLRPPIVTIRATALDGREFTLRCAGLLARCCQHEMDHLDGVLIIDRFTQMSRMKARSAVRELEKSAADEGRRP